MPAPTRARTIQSLPTVLHRVLRRVLLWGALLAEIHRTKLLILGAGPAGYTAAIYAARAGLGPLVVAGMQPGGQLTITTDVENYPGFAAPIQGPWLMDQMRGQAEHVGARIHADTIVNLDLSRHPFLAEGDSGDRYEAEALVIATGAQARWLGIPGERELAGFGVSACATCDGFFFRGKEVAVIGGGNTAVEEALYLSGLAAKVTVIHRREGFRAERILQERLRERSNVSVLWNTVVDAALPGAAAREAPALLEPLMRALGPVEEAPPGATLRVPPALLDHARARFGAAGLPIEADPALPEGDARIVWRHGGLDLDLSRRRAAIREALAALDLPMEDDA